MTLTTQAFLILTAIVGILPFAYRLAVSRQDFSVAEIVPPAAALFFGGTPFLWLLLRDSAVDRHVGLGAPAPLETAAMSFLLYTIGAVFCLFWVRSLNLHIDVRRIISHLHHISTRTVLVAFAFLWSLRLLLAGAYGVYSSDSGTVQAVEGIPYLLVIALSLAGFFGPLLPAWGASQFLARKRGAGFLAFLLIASEALYAFGQGRRAMLFLTLLLVIVYLCYRRRVNLTFIMVIGLGTLVLATTVFPLFVGVRELTSRDAIAGRFPITAYYAAAGSILLAPDLMDIHRRNLAHRSAVYIIWSAEIIEAQKVHSKLGGQAVKADFMASIPRLLQADKSDLEWAESLVNSHYGIAARDSPSSVAAFGLADFGIPGSLLYGFLFVFSLVLWEALAVRALDVGPVVCVAAIFQLLALGFHVELSLNTVFVVWRDFVLLLLLACALKCLLPMPRRQTFGTAVVG